MKIIFFIFFSFSNFIITSEFLQNISLLLINKDESIDLDSIDSQTIKSSKKFNSIIFEFKNEKALENHMKFKLYNNFYEISACFSKKANVKFRLIKDSKYKAYFRIYTFY